MTIDWRTLAPHKPLDPGDPGYVAPPGGGGGKAIADWIKAGGSTVLVGGPTGIGKSTELAQAAALLQAERVACLVHLDRLANIHKLEPERLNEWIAGRLVAHAITSLHLPVSQEVRFSLTSAQVLEHELLLRPLKLSVPFVASANAAKGTAVAEVQRLSGKRVVLLIDGLEKVGQGPEAAALFAALGETRSSGRRRGRRLRRMFGPCSGGCKGSRHRCSSRAPTSIASFRTPRTPVRVCACGSSGAGRTAASR
jgi:hypothetical protein